MEKGGVLTEFMSGTEPIAPHFVQRNRIVAGLADAVVVVESKEKGGSLITASMACDYDRDLFAFPGRPTDQLASGCNKLIRDNKAQLITSADDLILAMKWDEDNNRSPIQTRMVELMETLTPNQQIIMQLLQTAEEGMHINLIVMETQMNYGDVAAEMLMLEVQGTVKAYPGGVYRVVR
jgi:DNA processing protein